MHKKNITRKIGKHVVSSADNGNIPVAFGEALLTVEQVAELLHCSVSSLNKWRVFGRGPRFVKVERRVRYRPADVAAYVAAATKTSTSQQESNA